MKTASNNRQILEANFQVYLDGFSDNVKEIIELDVESIDEVKSILLHVSSQLSPNPDRRNWIWIWLDLDLGFKLEVTFTPITNLGNRLRLEIVVIEVFSIINIRNWRIKYYSISDKIG